MDDAHTPMTDDEIETGQVAETDDADTGDADTDDTDVDTDDTDSDADDTDSDADTDDPS